VVNLRVCHAMTSPSFIEFLMPYQIELVWYNTKNTFSFSRLCFLTVPLSSFNVKSE
jgi:hypothetical protein